MDNFYTRTAPALTGDYRASEPQESTGRSKSAGRAVKRLPSEQRIGLGGTQSSSEMSSDSSRAGARCLFRPLVQSSLAISLQYIYFKADHPYGVLLPGWLVLSSFPGTVLAPTAAVEDCCLLSSSSRSSPIQDSLEISDKVFVVLQVAKL